VVEEHTSVKVKVNERGQIFGKPIVEVKSTPGRVQQNTLTEVKKGINLYIPLSELTKLFEQFDVRLENLEERKLEFRQIVVEYFRHNPEYINHKKSILERIPHCLK
jgi:hypothetical protein